MATRAPRQGRGRIRLPKTFQPTVAAITWTAAINAGNARITTNVPVSIGGLPKITVQGVNPLTITPISPTVFDLHYTAAVVATNVLTVPANDPAVRSAPEASSLPVASPFNSFLFDAFVGMMAGSIDGKQGWVGPINMGDVPTLITNGTAPTTRVNRLWVPYLTTVVNADSDAENATALDGLDLTKTLTASFTWVVNPGYGPSMAGDWPEFMVQFGGDDGGATCLAMEVQYNPDSTANIQVGNVTTTLVNVNVPLATGIPHTIIATITGTACRITIDGSPYFVGPISPPSTWGASTVYVCLYGKPNPQQNIVQSITVSGTHT